MKLREPRDTSAAHPHIQMRTAAGRDEPFVPGTGLAVWEIVWVSRLYGGDLEQTREHLDIDPDLIDEALRYAREFPDEVERSIQIVEEASVERLQSILPGIRILDMNFDRDGEANR
jgi:uncharacterized protein (DUF433 family)